MKELLYQIHGLLPETISLSVQRELTITEDIDGEIDEAAAKFGYFATLSEKSETRYQKLKYAFEKWQAEVETSVNRERKDEGEKHFTEAQMKAYLRSQPKYGAYQSKLIDLDEHRRILKSITKAFEIRAGLVQTKASNRRSELNKTRR